MMLGFWILVLTMVIYTPSISFGWGFSKKVGFMKDGER